MFYAKLSRPYVTPALILTLLAACADGGTPPITGPRGVASVAVAPADLSLLVGTSRQLTAVARDESGAAVPSSRITWVSSDTMIAAVNGGGLVSARGVGTAMIRASSEGKVGSVAVIVTAPAPATKEVTWIVIVPAGGLISQELGTSRQLGVVARASDGTEVLGRPVTWSSSNAAVATISPSGLLEAHAPGAAWAVASVDGRRDSTLVSVASRIVRITTDVTELTLGVGDTRLIVATALDANGAPLSRSFAWSSSNGAVLTVDATGRVVATGAGTAIVTVMSEGRQATVRVTVTGQQWRLVRAGDAPLPASFTMKVALHGAERDAAVELTGGTLRMRDGRYELRVYGWATVAGEAPVPMTFGSDGVFAYDLFSGAPMFHEGDVWLDRTPRFRSQLLADGRLELSWNAVVNGAIVPLVFVMP